MSIIQVDCMQKISTDDQNVGENDLRRNSSQNKEFYLKETEGQKIDSQLNEQYQRSKEENRSILTSSSEDDEHSQNISSNNKSNSIQKESLSPDQHQKNQKVFYLDSQTPENNHLANNSLNGSTSSKKIIQNNTTQFIVRDEDSDDPDNDFDIDEIQVKNLDNGTVSRLREPEEENAKISMINEKEEESCFQYLVLPKAKQTKKSNRQTGWHRYWKEVQRFNDELFDYTTLGDHDGLKQLLEQPHKFPVSVNVKQIDNWTALHHAASLGFYKIAKLLTDHKASLNALSVQQSTPLHLASKSGSFPIVELLLKLGADCTLLDREQNNCLHYAAAIGHKDIINILLAHKCDPNQMNMYQQSPLDCSKSKDILQIFLDYLHIDMDAYMQRLTQIYGKTFWKNELRNNSRAEHVSNILRLARHFRNHRVLSPVRMSQTSFEKVPVSSNSLSQLNSCESIDTPGSSYKKRKRAFQNILKLEQIIIQNRNSKSQLKLSKTKSLSPTKSQQPESVGPDDFQIVDELGKGAFGKVYKVKKRDNGKIYAMKALLKEKVFGKNLVKYARTERNVLSQLTHPFIVKLHYAFQTENKLYFVMDYCPGGDLDQQLYTVQRFKENQAKLYLAEILLALEALHEKGIIYRDLKPGNIVIDAEGHAMLTDFGLSKQGVQRGDLLKSFCGSIAYLAPEMLEKSGHTFSLDWYLFGVLAYELLSGYPPFYNDEKEKLLDNIRFAKLKFPNYFSKKSKDFISALMRRVPTQRLGAQGGASEIKSHEFFKEVNWEKVYNRVYKPPKINKDLFMLDVPIEREIKITFARNTDRERRSEQNDPKFLMNWSFAIQEQQQEEEN